jgi:hypothetical protein
MRERWVVISNCQSFGLANSIECLAKTVECTACDVWEFGRIIANDPDHFMQYDFALLLPEAERWEGFDRARLPPHKIVPAFQFAAYHPDSVYVWADGQPFKGVVDAYQSMIALAAYKEGLDAERAATFYNADIYRAAGFFGQWDPHRDWLIHQFRQYQIDIRPIFVRRARARPIMHTVNHPIIEVLFDIAREVLLQLDRPIFAGVAPPPDNLASLVWPIYPEVGETMGLAGSYLFKPVERHKPLELVEFVDESLRRFSAWDRSQLRVMRNLEPALQRIRRHMREAA